MAETPQNTAFNEAAPASERFDAQAELTRAYRPLASELIPSAELQPVIDYINSQFEDQGGFAKAENNIVDFPGSRRKVSDTGMRSVHLDELQTIMSGDYFEKPADLDFDSLRDLCLRTPLLSSIVTTRVRQVTSFCQPSEDGGAGFTVRHQDSKKKLTGDDLAASEQLTQFIRNCGWEANPRRRKALKRDSFTQFMSKSVFDSLMLDSAPIETEMRRGKNEGLDGFYAVDGTTIRLCAEQGYHGDDEIFALQVVQGRLQTSYTYDQLIYEVRNPRSDVRLSGYGLAEPELLVKIITGWLNALAYNTSGFDNNAIPKGLLHLTGNYGQDDLISFKRQWNMMVKGINNRWALPVLISKDQESRAGFEKFGVEFDEMAFSKFMTLLTSVACAIYGISPEEINIESFSSNKSSFSGSDTESKIEQGLDKGFRPLMAYYEAMITDFMITDFSPKLCFRWVGLDKADPKQQWDEDKMAMTWGELRQRRGDAPLADKTLEGAPLNPSLIGPWQAALQAQQQAAQGPDYGEGQGGGDFGGGPPGADTSQAPGGDQGDAGAPMGSADQGQGQGAPQAGGAPPDAGQGDDESFGKALTASAVYVVE